MAEGEETGAPSESTGAASEPKTDVASTPPPWAPPQTREDFERDAESYMMNKPDKRTIGGKEITKTWGEWSRHNAQNEGLNARHQRTVAENQQLVAQARRYEAALETVKNSFGSPDGFRSLARALGVDANSLVAAMVEQERQYAALTPEQRRILELEGEVRSREQERMDAAQRAQAEALQRETDAQTEYFLDGFDRGMQEEGWDVPDAMLPHAVAIMSAIASDALERGIPMTFRQVVRAAKTQLAPGDYRQAIASMRPEDRLGLLTDEDRQLMRKRDLEAANRPRTHHSQTQSRDSTGQFREERKEPIIVNSFRDLQRQRGRL